MRNRISEHLRGNVVGYIALFLALTGGTAYALDGSNTVFSDDIVDGQVRSADLADGRVLNPDLGTNSVTGAKVDDGSLTGTDLADRSIGGQKIGTETLAGVNVADGSLFGADIANDSLTSQDIAGHAVGSSELDPGAFVSSDIAQVSASDPRYEIPSNAIQGSEVSDNSLTGADIDESTLDTPEAAYAKTDNSLALPSNGDERTIASRTVEPGSYVVLAKSSLQSDDGEFATCRIVATRSSQSFNLDVGTGPTVKPSVGLPGWGNIEMVGFVGSSSSNIKLDFLCLGDGVTAYNIRLAAVKVNRLIGTNAP